MTVPLHNLDTARGPVPAGRTQSARPQLRGQLTFSPRQTRRAWQALQTGIAVILNTRAARPHRAGSGVTQFGPDDAKNGSALEGRGRKPAQSGHLPLRLSASRTIAPCRDRLGHWTRSRSGRAGKSPRDGPAQCPGPSSATEISRAPPASIETTRTTPVSRS